MTNLIFEGVDGHEPPNGFQCSSRIWVGKHHCYTRYLGLPSLDEPWRWTMAADEGSADAPGPATHYDPLYNRWHHDPLQQRGETSSKHGDEGH